jgi:hypothetical protein
MKNIFYNLSYKKEIAYLLLFYTLCHGGILFVSNAIFWDDWTLFEVVDDKILNIFQQAGSMFNLAGYLHISLLSFGPWLYRYLTFILMFLAGVFLNLIIKNYKEVSGEYRFFIVLLFLCLPFYWARVALIDFPYTVCYFIFFAAWVLLDKIRILSLILFFVSFNTMSLLVFSIIPFLEFYYRNNKSNINSKTFLRYTIKNIAFAIIPFVFFTIKIIYFKPFGDYEGYNENYNIISLARVPIYMLLDLINFQPNLIIFCFILILLLSLFGIASYLKIKIISKVILLIGFICLLIGCFPYAILGHVPTFSEWTSRHQLLMPLGISIISASILLIVFNKFSYLFLALILSYSISLNINTYFDFYIDWQKQKQLISLFSKNAEIERGSILVFKDNTLESNAIDRVYRSYEWNGLLYQAFRNERRFGIGVKVFSSNFKMYFSNSSFNNKLIKEKFYCSEFRCSEFNDEYLKNSYFVEIDYKANYKRIWKPNQRYSIRVSNVLPVYNNFN